jgi:transposase
VEERIRELEAQLGQTSANSSRPPSSDPPQAPPRPKAPPSGRQRGGQPGHRGTCRGLLPSEQVDEVVVVVPAVCRHCEQPFPEGAARGRGRAWRHQVVELLPLAVRVTEYQMAVRRCAACGKRTRADLPPGVSRRPFGVRLTAVVALLSGRYRLSRREVRQLLQELWQVRVSLGAVVRQEQAQSAALAPIVEEARAAVLQAPVVNMDETGWQQEQQRACLWTVVTDTLTVFRIDRRRNGAVVEALLGADFTGVVGSDRWPVYNRFPAERRAICHAHLKRHFQGLVDRGGEAEPIGRWGLAEIERLFALWHRFRAGEFDRQELRRRLVPLQARLGRLLRRGQETPGSQSGGAVPRAAPVVGGAMDLHASGRRGADQQCGGAGLAASRAVAEGEFRRGQRSRRSVRGAAADRGSHLPKAGTAVAGVPGGRGRGGTPRNRDPIAGSYRTGIGKRLL